MGMFVRLHRRCAHVFPSRAEESTLMAHVSGAEWNQHFLERYCFVLKLNEFYILSHVCFNKKILIATQ